MKPLAYILNVNLLKRDKYESRADMAVMAHALMFGEARLIWFADKDTTKTEAISLLDQWDLLPSDVYSCPNYGDALNYLFKKNTYNEEIKDNYKVVAVIESDDDSAQLFRSMGLTVLCL